MKKIIIFLKLILRSKFIFKTPEQHDLVIFDDESIRDLNTCLSKFDFFVLQCRIGKPPTDTKYAEKKFKIYFSYKILKQILKNYFKGNLLTVYLLSLIELIKPKVVMTTSDLSYNFSDVAKILEKKIHFIAVQSALLHDFLEWDYLYKTKKIQQDMLKRFYIPNLFCRGDHEIDTWKQYVNVKSFYTVGNLRLANFFYHIKNENNSSAKYNCDICLFAPYHAQPSDGIVKENEIASKVYENNDIEKGYVKLVEYTIKFCLKHNMKLIIPLKRDKKYLPTHYKIENEFFERNFKKEKLDYIKRNILENDLDDFSSFRVMLNSKVVVSLRTTLLRDKLATGGKILSCNLTKIDYYNFSVNGICTLNNCSYEEFEKRLLEIYSISKENYFSKINAKPDYLQKFSKNYSTIDLIREKLSELGVNQNF